MNGSGECRVEVTRGGRVESVHEVAVAVADGVSLACAGSADAPVFVRSAIKPFQALPLVADGVADRFGLTDPELAVCCASHSGEPEHVAAALSILTRAGLGPDDLACGPHPPFAVASARALEAAGMAPGRVHNNCSGKHAGMLALARAHGWTTAGYHERGHPVQDRIAAELARWTGVPAVDMPTAVDGCGVVTFALSPAALATACARLATAAAAGEAAPARIVRGMARHPLMVGGSGRLCSRLIEVTEGRVLVKVGAEGVYAAVVLDRGLGIGLKVRDGARRAAEVALLAVLAEREAVSERELDELSRWAFPEVRNTRDEPVGEVRAVLSLEESVAERVDG
jgi:L-asparaginase II